MIQDRISSTPSTHTPRVIRCLELEKNQKVNPRSVSSNRLRFCDSLQCSPGCIPWERLLGDGQNPGKGKSCDDVKRHA
jgi:hypothetical protein